MSAATDDLARSIKRLVEEIREGEKEVEISTGGSGFTKRVRIVSKQ